MIEKTVSAEVEIREVGGVRRLEGTLIQEGRVGRVRAEVFAPNSIRWPGEGIGILVEHRSHPEVVAMPVPVAGWSNPGEYKGNGKNDPGC